MFHQNVAMFFIVSSIYPNTTIHPNNIKVYAVIYLKKKTHSEDVIRWGIVKGTKTSHLPYVR